MGEPDFSRMSPGAVARAQGLHPSRTDAVAAATGAAWARPAASQRVPKCVRDAPAPARSVIDAVCAASGLTAAQLTGEGQRQSVMPWRLCAYALLSERGYSSVRIGRLIGGRDHTTVLYGLRRWEAVAERPDYAAVRIAVLNALADREG